MKPEEIQQSNKETLNEVKLYQSQGWEVTDQTPEYYILKRNTASVAGHIVIAIFTWWTLGICNLIYWLACKQTKKIIK